MPIVPPTKNNIGWHTGPTFPFHTFTESAKALRKDISDLRHWGFLGEKTAGVGGKANRIACPFSGHLVTSFYQEFPILTCFSYVLRIYQYLQCQTCEIIFFPKIWPQNFKNVIHSWRPSSMYGTFTDPLFKGLGMSFMFPCRIRPLLPTRYIWISLRLSISSQGG